MKRVSAKMIGSFLFLQHLSRRSGHVVFMPAFGIEQSEGFVCYGPLLWL